MSSLVKCSPQDVIPIMNSNAATTGDAALACAGTRPAGRYPGFQRTWMTGRYLLTSLRQKD
jgi:hypothetical protein